MSVELLPPGGSMSEWESWVTEAEDQLATVRVVSPAPAALVAPRQIAPPTQNWPPAIEPDGPATTRPKSATRGFADEREVDQWAAAARRLRFGEETVRRAPKTSAASAHRPNQTSTFDATEADHSPRWKPFSPFVAPSDAARAHAESPGDLIDLRTPIAAVDPETLLEADDDSALERLNLINTRLRDAVATRLTRHETHRAQSAASQGRSQYGEDAVAEWWADCHWRSKTVARYVSAWRRVARERIARERRLLAEKAAELAALARARERSPRAVARRAWIAMEAADRRAGRSSLSPCPADLAPAPARSRRALTFELAASLELGTGKNPSADAFGSPEVLLRDPKPPASPLSPLNIAAIEQEHETLRVEEEMDALKGADLWDVRNWMRNHAAAALSAWRAQTAWCAQVRHRSAVADAQFVRRRCITCVTRWRAWAATHRRDRIVTETYGARHDRRTKGALFSRWRDKVTCARSVRASVAFALEQYRRRGLLPAWHRWAEHAAEERSKGEEATARWFRVCAGSMLQQWRRFALHTRREREWLEFVDNRWRRAVLERALGNWAKFTDAAMVASETADARYEARIQRTFEVAFVAWRKRAAHIAASYELVRLACLQWRHERASAAFRTFVDAGKEHRSLLDAVGEAADARHRARRFVEWKAVVTAELAKYQPAMDAMLVFVRRMRLRRTMRAFTAHAQTSRDIARDRANVMVRRKRARLYDAWWHVTAAKAKFNVEALAKSFGTRHRFQSRLGLLKLSNAATEQRRDRDALHARAEDMDARGRCSRAINVWSGNARDIIRARNQWNAAVHHRNLKILTAWVEWRRQIRVTFAERKRTSGRNAMRRVAITFAVWYEFTREMRSLRRPMLKYIESQQQSQQRGGFWHGGRFIGPGTTPAEKAKRLALARLKARRRLDTQVKATNQSLSYIGPVIEAAARSRCGRMMKHLRAAPDFDSVADWYGLRWENMMESKYLFAWTGMGAYSGADLGTTTAVEDTEPESTMEASEISEEPSPVEKFDVVAEDSVTYLEPLDLDRSRRLADVADVSSIDGASFYVTPAMTPAASPAPKAPVPSGLGGGAREAAAAALARLPAVAASRLAEENDAIRRLRDVAALGGGGTGAGVNVTWSPSKPPVAPSASRSQPAPTPLEVVAEAPVELSPPPPPSKTLPTPRADPKTRSQLEVEKAEQEKERKLAKKKSKGK